MKTALIEAIKKAGYTETEILLQGTMAEDVPYPDDFVTFFTIDTSDAAHFDNSPAFTAWQFQITQYSSNPLNLEAKAQALRETLKQAGFIPVGKGRDIPSDEPSHTGWTQEYYYISKY